MKVESLVTTFLHLSDFVQTQNEAKILTTWYIGMCKITTMGLLLYRLTFWSKRFNFMFGFGFYCCFSDGCTMYGWSHGYAFASSMGHLRSDSIGLLVYDGMRKHQGHQCCIRVPWDSVKRFENGLICWVSHIV
jgi:hypothetical protein